VTAPLGIDPGMSGAVAWLDGMGNLLDACDMPVVNKQLNTVDLALLLGRIDDDTIAVVEQVHSMPGQGVSSTFKFGTAYGAVLGALGALQIRTEHVTPQMWKKHHTLIGKDKDAARAKAIDRWPSMAHLFARKKDCGRADAALIALWHIERRSS